MERLNAFWKEKNNCYSVPSPLLCWHPVMNAPTSLLLLLRWFTEMFDTKLWERRGFGHFLLFLQQSFEACSDESPFSSSLPLSSLICFLWRLIIRLFFLSLPFLSQCTNTGASVIIGKDCAKVFTKLRGVYNSDLISNWQFAYFRRARAGSWEDLCDGQWCDPQQALHLPLQVQRGALQRVHMDLRTPHWA